MPPKYGKSAKQRRDTAVQGTNDSSIVSKCSAAQLGYFRDDFVQHFVAKQVRRSPLINRGYYIRSKAVQRAFEIFFTRSRCKKQVISLGCGFDSAYWKLQADGCLQHVVYIEIDFPDVVERKIALIESKPVLHNLIPHNTYSTEMANVVYDSADYKLVGVDLSNLKLLETALKACGVDFDQETMLLSEVAITYMSTNNTVPLLHWAGQVFSNAVFVNYEQILPYDAFGIVMLNHFKKIGSKLRNIEKYATRADHIQRSRDCGWCWCNAMDMNEFYSKYLPMEEKQRINQIEPFDEFEEWHLKCAHYILMVAGQGSGIQIGQSIFTDGICTSDLSDAHIDQQMAEMLKKSRESNCENKGESVDMLLCDKSSSVQIDCIHPVDGGIKITAYGKLQNTEWTRRFGHTCCLANENDVLVTVGGFGEKNKLHQKIKLPHIHKLNSLHETYCSVSSGTDSEPIATTTEKKQAFERLYSSLTNVGSGLILFGGRCSPKNCTENYFISLRGSQGSKPKTRNCSHDILSQDGSSGVAEQMVPSVVEYAHLKTKGSGPCPRWRHSATVMDVKGHSALVIYGGRTLDQTLGDCYYLHLHNFTWSQMTLEGDVPVARHSNTTEPWRGKLVVAGGLTAAEQLVGDICFIDVESFQCSQLTANGLLIPRYSHTSALVGDRLLLLGGVTTQPETTPGLALVDLLSGQSIEFLLPPVEPERPLMLHNHQSVMIREGVFLVLGGGGNCFSFGTHLNQHPVLVDCSQCLQTFVK